MLPPPCGTNQISTILVRKLEAFILWNSVEYELLSLDIWSKEGVRTIPKPVHKSVLCQTNHLTNFALILDVSQTGANPLALQVITWVGCGISLAGLILTVIAFGALR